MKKPPLKKTLHSEINTLQVEPICYGIINVFSDFGVVNSVFHNHYKTKLLRASNNQNNILFLLRCNVSAIGNVIIVISSTERNILLNMQAVHLLPSISLIPNF